MTKIKKYILTAFSIVKKRVDEVCTAVYTCFFAFIAGVNLSYVIEFALVILLSFTLKPIMWYIIKWFLFVPSPFWINVANVANCMNSGVESPILERSPLDPSLNEGSSTDDSFKGLSDDDYLAKCLNTSDKFKVEYPVLGIGARGPYSGLVCPSNSFEDLSSNSTTADVNSDPIYGPRRLLTDYKNILDPLGSPIKFGSTFPSVLRQTVSVLSTTDSAPFFNRGPDFVRPIFPPAFSGTPKGFMFESEKELIPVQIFTRRFKSDFGVLGEKFEFIEGNEDLFKRALKEFMEWFTKITSLETDISEPLTADEEYLFQSNRNLALSNRTLFDILSGNIDIISDLDDTSFNSIDDDTSFSQAAFSQSHLVAPFDVDDID